MKPYIDYNEYLDMGYSIIPQDTANSYLLKASLSIDTLTFNRIKSRYDKLTDRQLEIIKYVTAELANFLFENESLLDTILQEYSINGVSMKFGSSWNVKIVNGVAIKRDLYNVLAQTGLCYRGV